MSSDGSVFEVNGSIIKIALNALSENAHINVIGEYFDVQVTPQKNP